MSQACRAVGFLCRWCADAAAHRAGRRRLELPPEFLPVRVPCAGRVTPEAILRAFAGGASGVAVLGCHPRDCHYGSGNVLAAARTALLRRVLVDVGVGAERLYCGCAGASEAERFASEVRVWVERLRQLPARVPAGAQQRLECRR